MPTSTQKTNASYSNSERITWLNENILTYQTNIKKRHFFNSMIGFTLQDSKLKNYSMSSILIPNESLGMAGMGQGTPSNISSIFSDWSMMSFLGRINYNYKSKYYLTASFRADGSSKFVQENKFGYFPSLSSAWNFSQENFMKPFKEVVHSGKLRLSWGVTGNNRVGEYDTYARILMQKVAWGYGTGIYDVFHGVYPFDNSLDNIGAIINGLPNKELKWETTSQTNAGIDLSFLNDRVSFTMDWYNKITSNLLLRASIPLSTGFASVMKNIGKVQNQGLEFTINTINIDNNKFKWTSNFNISFNKNKVLDLSENQLSLLTNASFDQNFISPNYIAKIGFPVGMMYGYKYEGTYKLEDFNVSNNSYKLKSGIPSFVSEANTQPGYPRYADLNEDGVIDTKDQTIIGRGDPIHIGGFTNNFEYAGFDLSIFLQWSLGSNILNANRLIFESGFNRRSNLNQFASYIDRWTFDNLQSDIPRVSSSSSNNVFSSRVIEDGSYLRLKTISLGYSINQHLLKKLKLTKVRMYVSTQNLYTLTNYSGFDPEVSVRNSALTPGLDFSAYPQALSINMGVNVIF
jgi:TonB-linked SusC/RagA family outer membrane protein